MILKLELHNVFTMCPPVTSKMIFQKLAARATNTFQSKDMYVCVCVSKCHYKDLAFRINFWTKLQGLNFYNLLHGKKMYTVIFWVY